MTKQPKQALAIMARQKAGTKKAEKQKAKGKKKGQKKIPVASFTR